MSAIWGLFGNLGAGKTSGLSVLTKLAYNDGNRIFTNYNLYGYPNRKISNTITLESVPLDMANWFAMDEFWQDVDARNSFSNRPITKAINQSRKRRITLVTTAQDIFLFDRRLRSRFNLILFPQCVEDDSGYPIAIVYFYTRDKKWEPESDEDILSLPSFVLPTLIGGFDCIANYDTREIVREMKRGEEDETETLLNMYKNWKGTKTDLTSILVYDHKFSGIQADRTASYIIAKQRI